MMLCLPTIGLQLIGYGGCIIALYCITGVIYRLFIDPLKSYPGPLLAGLTDAYAGLHSMMMQLHLATWENHRQYGRIVRLGPNKLVFNSATALKDIYSNDRLSKSHVYLTTLKALHENTWSTVNKQTHRSRRRMIGAVLHEPFLRKFQPTIISEINVLLGIILDSCNALAPVPLDMTEKFHYLTLDIIGHLAFGLPHRTQTTKRNRFLAVGLTVANYHANVMMQFPALAKSWLVSLMYLLTTRLQQKNLASFRRTVQRRMDKPVDAAYDMYYAITKQIGAGHMKGIEPNEVWTEAAMLYVAGGETSATTMSALFFYLSRHPDIYSKLAAEIRSTFSSGYDVQSGLRLASCRYLRACIDETLRIAPPAPGIMWRELAHDDTKEKGPLIIDGHVIRPGTQVGVCTYALHHNEEYFPEPFVFNPERWLGPNQTSRESPAFAPFSLGSRSCAGKSMAYMEIGLTVAKILWYFDFKRASGHLSDVGGGRAGKKGNRGRVDEYQLYDVFTAAHKGPMLTFQVRGDYWMELDTAHVENLRSADSSV